MDGRGLSSSHWQQQGKEQQQEEQELGGGGGRTGDQEAEIVKIAYTNAQSVLNKLNELSAYVADSKPDIILITETWCNPSIDNSLLKIPDYDVHTDLRRDREDTQHGIGGGLLVYVGPGISIINRDDAESDSRFNQYCSFDVVGLEEKWTIYLVYTAVLRSQSRHF